MLQQTELYTYSGDTLFSLPTHFISYQNLKSACLWQRIWWPRYSATSLTVTPQAYRYDIVLATLFWQQVNHFLCWTTLYMSTIRQVSFTYIFQMFDLTNPILGIEPWIYQTLNLASTTRLLMLVWFVTNCIGFKRQLMLGLYL